MANYTGTNWVTRTCIATDILSTIDEGLGQAVSDIKTLNADLTDMDILNKGTELPIGADLNDYLTVGKYYSLSASRSSTLTNAPTATVGFSLYVLRVGDTSTTQVAISAARSASCLYIRNYSYSTEAWGQWMQAQMTAISTSSVGDPVVMGED